jgi:hypothetical protein
MFAISIRCSDHVEGSGERVTCGAMDRLLLNALSLLERAKGIEPSYEAWEAEDARYFRVPIFLLNQII